MNKEKEIMRFGHIRLVIQSDFTCDSGNIHYNAPETMMFTTMNDNDIKSIVYGDKAYHECVVRLLKEFAEKYKEKYL